ncbi:MAG: PD40 domain-containing protein [Anaerolineae bacterium]|nr:MAG: PD40 domain-containing protein [Anaerolineae bacterium]
MKRYYNPSILSISLLMFTLVALTACDTFEVGIERTPTPEASAFATKTAPPAIDTPVQDSLTPIATAISPATPTATPTEVSDVAGWQTYTSLDLGVSLKFPPHWQLVPEYGGEKHAAEDGFFMLGAIGSPGATVDDIAASQAGHTLRPYGSQPIIEDLHVQGQEARLIMPSADAGEGNQAMLIVRYPQPVEIAGSSSEDTFLALYADQDHIRLIAQTLRFTTDSLPTQTATLAPPIAWQTLPPGLVYSTQDGLWLVNGDEEPVQVHNNPQAVLSFNGNRLLSYDALQQDLWLLDLTEGSIWNLTRRPDRVECCFRWWPGRPDVVLFHSAEKSAERDPTATECFLTAINIDGQGYRILDAQHNTNTLSGPGQFAPSPDGQTVAYGSDGMGWLYHWERGTELFDPADYGLTGSKGVQIGSPAWSPDGTRLAWVVGGGLAKDGSYRVGVGVFDLGSRTSWVVHPYEPAGRGGWPAAPVWSPDGTWLAFAVGSQAMDEAGVWVLRADGQQLEEYNLGHGGHPIWSPDGRWLAFEGLLENGLPAYLVVEVGTWELRPLNISPDRYGKLVDWINPWGLP